MKQKNFIMKKADRKARKGKKNPLLTLLGIVCLIAIIIFLILLSLAAARISAQRKTSYKNDFENTYSEGDSAYDLFFDDNISNDTRDGLKVMLGDLYNSKKNTSEREVAVTGEASDSSFYQGDAGTLEKMEMRIKESVLSQMKNSYGEVIEGAAGNDGLRGEQGQQGKQGERGVAGATGKNGMAGQAGSVGATGEKGETGEAGADGLSTFIAYADNESGTNMGAVPKETSKYIGTYQGTVRSSDPKDYSWTEYKDKIITFSNENGQPTLKIFN